VPTELNPDHADDDDDADNVCVAGKFSLGSGRKKDRSRLRTVPDTGSISSVVWPVTVEDFSLDMRVECFMAVGCEMMVLVDAQSRVVVFATPCTAVTGWTVLQSNASVFSTRFCIDVELN